MKSILIAALLLTQIKWTVAPIPPVAPQKLDFIVVADGYCSIDKEGVIALENGKTQAECLRFNEMNKNMQENSDRCEREKKHIFDVWESTIPKFPKKKQVIKRAAPERGDSK
jgi:hypothetical protein